MDSKEMEQIFNAFYAAILQNDYPAARHIFETTLQNAANKILDRAIHIAIAEGAFSSVEEIQRLKD